MGKPLIYTIDFGTQSVRAALFDKEGNIVALEKVPYEEPYFVSRPGYAEQHADYFYDHMIRATSSLKEKHSSLFKDVVGLSLTTFRDTAVLLDKDKKPLRPCIMWLDQRQAPLTEKIPLLHRALFKLVGMSSTIRLNRRRSASLWIKANEPQIWEKCVHYVALSTYFNYRITGELKDSPANQIGHYPIDFKKGRWNKYGALKGGNLYGIKNELLCELVPLASVIGVVSEECSKATGIPAGLSLFATGTDKSCETLGTGALASDVAAVSYGTASTINVCNKKYHEPETFLPAYQACTPGFYNMEVQIYRGYWMISWFKAEFGEKESVEALAQQLAVEEILNEKLQLIPPGSNGLVLQPYWGPGLKRPDACGAIIGFSATHTKMHLYRSIIEGIGYALREALEGIEKKQFKKVKEIRISGGGSQSDVICQITADIFGLPVSRVQTYETTSLGAAIAGFIAAKEFSDAEEAVAKMVRKSDTFYPNAKAHEEYDYLFYKVYCQMFPRLKDIYRDIRKHENY